MNAHALALSLASDLLTGTEWNAAQVRELFRLATDVKAHPDRYKKALAADSWRWFLKSRRCAHASRLKSAL